MYANNNGGNIHVASFSSFTDTQANVGVDRRSEGLLRDGSILICMKMRVSRAGRGGGE